MTNETTASGGTRSAEDEAFLVRAREIVRRGKTEPQLAAAGADLTAIAAAITDMKAGSGVGIFTKAFDHGDCIAFDRMIVKLRARAREIVEAHS